jgi:hypothetical protein
MPRGVSRLVVTEKGRSSGDQRLNLRSPACRPCEAVPAAIPAELHGSSTLTSVYLS